jgi:putative membrane-bound dehydrogenase-like protein
MKRPATLLTALAALLLAGAAGGDKIPQATDAPRPLSPEESRSRFRLPDGFRIEAVAAEPQVIEPTGVCFDARGRIFVCELHGYNLDGYYDILELNKAGKLDTSVRRIPASRDAEERAAKETYGTVRLLERDAAGRVVRSTVFADRLPPCYGVVAARDGVIVLCAPDIVFLADRDGDGKAEVRQTLFTGFGVGEIWTRISNPRWGPDNWIYAACGQGSAGTVRGPCLKEPVQLGHTCFRFKPDGSRLEPVSGGTSGFGLALDDWGDRFLCTNQQHALQVAPLPFAALARNPYAPAIDPVVNICTYGHPARVFPRSRPDPWRRKRGAEPAWVNFYGAAETTAGLFTSACAPTLYLAEQFPEAYRGNHFSCEPAQNLVHRCLLERKGARLLGCRADEGREFLTSSDAWFRPVNLAVGPEGALYVVDMYREIIEDYSAIPRYLQQQYVESLRNGHDKGRVWRVYHGERPPAANADLQAMDDGQLVAELGGANAWRRLTAQRLLIERGARKPLAALEKVARAGGSPQARLHALYTIDGLEALTPELVGAALGDAEPAVRVHALKLAERWLDQGGMLARVLKRADDPDPRVRLQLAFTLGASARPEVLPAVARLARAEGQDPWMRAAILSAVPERSAALARLLGVEADGDGRTLLRPLAAVAGARRDGEEISGLLRWLAGKPATDVRAAVLAGLVEGLARDPSGPKLPAAGREALVRLLEGATGGERKLVLRLAVLTGAGQAPAFGAARQALVGTALDEKRPAAERVEALGALAGAPPAELQPLGALLEPHQVLDVQLAAVAVLAAADAAAVRGLFERWKSFSPGVQTAILDAVCGRKDRLPLVLDALEKRQVDPDSLPAVRQTQLRESPDAEVRLRAKALLAAQPTRADRKLVLDRYQAALKLPRDAKKGRVVFEKQCAKCHRLGGAGVAVGPDLAAVENRPDESLLVDVLDPSSTIVPGYRAYTVTTHAGRVVTGILVAETATSITLRRDQGAEDTVLRKDIEELFASSVSLMPDGLEKEISPQEMADLIGYLREALRPARR